MLEKISNGVYKFTNTDLAIINSIRRVILSEIPNLALEVVTIHKNTSPLNNEFLTSRIQLIPIWFDPTQINEVIDYKFVIAKKNNNKAPLNVTSNDIVVYDAKGEQIDRKKMFPPNTISRDFILITKLMPNFHSLTDGQEINIEMKAIKGTAKEHAKWCTVSKCSYTFVTDGHPRNFRKDKYGQPSEIEFYIDSECMMSPDYLLTTAINIVIDKVKNYMEKATITQDNKLWNILIQGEDYTLINLLQSLIYSYEIKEHYHDTMLEYIGYYQTHPLEKSFVLKLSFRNNNVSIHDFLSMHNSRIIRLLENIMNNFNP